MKLSVVIPAYNEAKSISETICSIYKALEHEKIEHEILVINDNSQDNTLEILEKLKATVPSLMYITNNGPHGYGYATRKGLEKFTGDCAAIMMADLSDSPDDLLAFYNKMQEDDYDCIFGNRFIKGGKIIKYPVLKLILNRLGNHIVNILFQLCYTDCTNAFKLYKREAIEGLKPFLSSQFNLTLEMPLKAIVRGYKYTTIPNTWTNRKHSESKWKIKEISSGYLFILLYCLREKYFSKGDFKKKSY